MYPQGVCRIRKPAYAGNGCAIFPTFDTTQLGENIRCSAADDLFRDSLVNHLVKTGNAIFLQKESHL